MREYPDRSDVCNEPENEERQGDETDDNHFEGVVGLVEGVAGTRGIRWQTLRLFVWFQ